MLLSRSLYIFGALTLILSKAAYAAAADSQSNSSSDDDAGRVLVPILAAGMCLFAIGLLALVACTKRLCMSACFQFNLVQRLSGDDMSRPEFPKP